MNSQWLQLIIGGGVGISHQHLVPVHLTRCCFTKTLRSCPIHLRFTVFNARKLNAMGKPLYKHPGSSAPATTKKNVRITAPFYNSRDVSQKVANGASSDIRTMKKLYPIRLAQNLAVANGKGGERESSTESDVREATRHCVSHSFWCSTLQPLQCI